MTEYRLFKQSAYHRAVGFYDTFGISVFVDGELTRIVRDISADREKVERLARLFNEEQLDPVHLTQAVEDFLYDLCD